MQNIKLSSVRSCEFSKEINEVDNFFVDSVNERIYISTAADLQVIQGEKLLKILPWNEYRHGYRVTSLTVNCEGTLVAALSSGRILVCDENLDNVITIEVEVDVNAETSCSDWNNDQSVLAFADERRLHLLDGTFCCFASSELDFLEKDQQNAPVNVGWGSEQTQFRGSAGKAQNTGKDVSVPQEENVCFSTAKWRADNEVLVVSFFDRLKKTREMAIFDNSARPLTRIRRPIGTFTHVFAHKPNSNLILSVYTRAETDSHQICFSERNGELRDGFTINWSSGTASRKISRLEWNCCGTMLALQVTCDSIEQMEIWTVSNYEFCKKWAWIVPPNTKLLWKWSDQDGEKLHIVDTSSSKVYQFDFAWQTSFSSSLALNVVVAGDELRISNLCERAIPPPMCETTLKLEGDVCAQTTTAESIFVLLSNLTLHIYSRSERTKLTESGKAVFNKSNGFEVLRSLAVRGSEAIVCVHLNGCDAILSWDLSSGDIQTVFTAEKSKRIVWAGVNPSTTNVEFVTECGKFYEVMRSGEAAVRFSTVSAYSVVCEYIKGSMTQRVLLCNEDLFLDEERLASNVTSFLVRCDDVIFTDLSNRLRFVACTGKVAKPDDVRELETGSELVACSSTGTSVVLQMPRGNLETIHPRRFALQELRLLLDRKEYERSLKFMKKHRIDMNFCSEHCKETLVADVPKIVAMTNDAQLLEQLLLSCSSESNEESVKFANDLCCAFVTALENAPKEKRRSLFTVQLAAFLRTSPPRVADALSAVKTSRDVLADDEAARDSFTRRSLHHITFFVSPSQLFNAALSTYDLHFARTVAEASNQDPKEFLPILNELNSISSPDVKRYRVDCVRKDWERAVVDLLALDDDCENDDWWDELKQIVDENSLHAYALQKTLRGSKRFADVCGLYAVDLEARKEWKEAAMFYELAEAPEMSIDCWFHSLDLESFVEASRRFDVDVAVIRTSIGKLANTLKGAGRLHDYAKALLYADASQSDVAKAFCLAQEWTLALGQARAASRRLEDVDPVVAAVREAASKRAAEVVEEVERRTEDFEKTRGRLEVVRDKKKQQVLHRDDDDMENFRDDMSQVSSTSSRSNSSRTSVASTVRRRKQIERKKGSLKEGGEYEDSALLFALAAHVDWIASVQKESEKLVPTLMQLGEVDVAITLRNTVGKLARHMDSRKSSIWPTILQPWLLPGPVQVLYSETAGETYQMPHSIRLEPELIAPSKTLN